MDESSDESVAESRREQQDEIVMAALVAGHTYVQTAGLVGGMSERTIRRRMADPMFAGEVSRRRGERAAALAGQLVSTGAEAVDVLRDCLDSDNDGVRLRAAQLVLGLGNQFRHATELEARLAALESAADRSQQRAGA